MRLVAFVVKRSICLLGIMLILPLSMAARENDQTKGPVKAKEPTSVTIYGRRENVDAQALEREPARKSGGGLKKAAAKAWNGLIGFGGWLLNVDDDIPSEREQRSRKEQRK